MPLNNVVDIARSLLKAIPTVDENGFVKTWRVCIGYSCNEYIKNFEFDIRIENPNKTPNDFTQQEILNLCNLEKLDRAFNTARNSLFACSPEITITTFDVTDLN